MQLTVQSRGMCWKCTSPISHALTFLAASINCHIISSFLSPHHHSASSPSSLSLIPSSLSLISPSSLSLLSLCFPSSLSVLSLCSPSVLVFFLILGMWWMSVFSLLIHFTTVLLYLARLFYGWVVDWDLRLWYVLSPPPFLLSLSTFSSSLLSLSPFLLSSVSSFFPVLVSFLPLSPSLSCFSVLPSIFYFSLTHSPTLLLLLFPALLSLSCPPFSLFLSVQLIFFLFFILCTPFLHLLVYRSCQLITF